MHLAQLIVLSLPVSEIQESSSNSLSFSMLSKLSNSQLLSSWKNVIDEKGTPVFSSGSLTSSFSFAL